METSNLHVRPAEPGDLDAIFEIYVEVVQSGGAHPTDDIATRETFDEGWTRKRAVYAAREGNRTVAGYFLKPNFPAFAAHIAQAGYLVSSGHRRRGIGGRLVDHSLHEAMRLGYSAMMFNLVDEANPSRRIYERAGFAVIGRIPHAHHNSDGLIYWRDLTGHRPTP